MTEMAPTKLVTAELFKPYRLGDIELANRSVVGPAERHFSQV